LNYLKFPKNIKYFWDEKFQKKSRLFEILTPEFTLVNEDVKNSK